jgi:hypothetical protein
VVVDLDGDAGRETWLKQTRGQNIARHVPHTWEVVSGSGKGRHLIFTLPDGVTVESKIRVLPGIDIKSGGAGYIVGAGSSHISGGVYRWAAQCGPDDIAAPAGAPEWITDLAPKRRKRSLDQWRNLASKTHKEGTRTDAVCALAGHLLAIPFNDPVVILELLHGYNEGRCKPPLDDARIFRIVDDFCGHALKRGNSNE